MSQLVTPPLRGLSLSAAAPPDTDRTWAEEIHPFPLPLTVAGHELTIFVESPPLFEAVLADMERAQKRLWVETYIFVDDTTGKRVAEVLKTKAKAGLDVRVMYDAVGSFATPNAFFLDLQRAGVKIHAFHSVGEAFARFAPLRLLNRRNHRKLIIVDDEVGYFGGMNIVDQSGERPGLPRRKLPFSAGWRDVHLRLRGPQQAEMAESFERSWTQSTGGKVTAKPRPYRKGKLRTNGESIQFFDSGPGRRNTRAARVFMELFTKARQRILVSMAYFLPIGRVLGRLLQARRKGVRVRVVVPASSDVPIVQRACRHLCNLLVKRGFMVYERQRQMLHSKAMVIDDEWSVVGSCNLDPRSLWINSEFLAVIHSRRFAHALTKIIRYEISHSDRLTHRDVKATGWWQRSIDRMAWSLRWWL
jgi:cardiolipin synthase A/B